ncbi:hypothetical protein Tco_0791180 [Tanacetum coccineum]
MTTLAEHIIVARAENRPPMLEKSMYDSWASQNGQTRPKKYFELTKAQQLQDNCDVQATNIILHGLPPDVYALVNQQEAAKDIWDRVKMLMKGTELSYQERECKLYNLFDKFAHVSGSLMYLPSQQFTSVYAAPIHHQHHHTSVNSQQHPVSTPPFISPSMTPQSQAEFPQLDSSLAVPMFRQGEDPIECINKAMEFLSDVASRQNQSYVGTGNRVIATTSKGNVAAGPSRVVKCYNCQGEWHMARHSFQTYDLDAYDLDYDDLSSPKAVMMANLSSCDPEILSEVPYSDSYPNDMINQDVQEMQYSEQTHVDDFKDNEIYSGSNIIPYSQYLQESQDAVIQDTNPSTPNDLLVPSLVEQMIDHVAHLDKENQTNKMVNESLTAELERYKERIAIFEQRLNVDLNQREKLIDS